MKVRKLAVALALVGGLGSGVANALGLGEVELQSYLNQPLDADIELRNTGGVGPNEVYVNLASQEVFDRVGIDREFFLTNLKFNVATAPNGQLVIHVTTKQAVREPYLNFLIEVTWPNGKLLREYSMLLDPPVYAEKVGDSVAQPVQAPSSRSQASTPSRAAASSQPRRASSPTSSPSSRSDGRTFGPTGPSDTLWGIALQVRPDDSYTPQQVMLALQDQNPDAFMDGNINRLKRGQVLRIPTAEQIESRTSQQAYQQVVAQNQALKKPAQTVDATGQQPGQASSQPARSGDELRLSAGNDSTSPEKGASSGGAEGVAGGKEGSTEVVMEQLDKAERENEELNSRVEDLEAQLATMQRLVELKNSQLAEMQAQAGKSGETATAGAEGESASSAPAGAADAGTGSESASDAEKPGALEGEQMASTGGESESAMAGGDMAAGDEASSDEGMMEQPEASSGEAEATAQAPSADEEAMSEEPSENTAATPAETEQQAPKPAEPAKPAAQSSEPAVEDKGFVGNIVEEFKNNRLYQIAGGGAAILVLLLLGLLARRNANREKAFYEQLNEESAHDDDHIDLGGESDHEEGEEKDALAEADAYIAYGRHDQAAEMLESAISREPSRTDLRLKLLAVYAENEDRAAFEKQYSELEALDDEQAMAEAQVLHDRLEEAESTPSIDDLESQLRSEVSSPSTEETTEDTFASLYGEASETSSYGEAEVPSQGEPETATDEDLDFDSLELDEEPVFEGDEEARKDSDAPIEYDISDLDFEEEDIASTDESAEPESSAEEAAAADDLDLDFNFDEDTERKDAADEPELSEEDFGSLELDDSLLEDEGSAEADRATSDDELPPLEEEPELTTDEQGNLDESFLDDLDAELEKVANETDQEPAESETADTLDELELDVSDEDLALMEEVAETPTDDQEEPLADDEIPELDEELNLEDSLADADDEENIPTAEESVEDESTESEEKPVAETRKESDMMDFDEASLDDEDDFDFLAGTDEAATKLDLARAYIEMGDSDGARDILEEVAIEGSDDQKTEAQDLLKNLA
ncbi:FimV/HubP family polar landmark protein [Marinobacter mangrovi]|uniref:FimV/HubP family polar landmark protein n=1 Tax=Marinobacter mangrovi TaxID=2803918 RepID=UPI001933F972|nr:FimV/HubP family polar landmark protein [Marinobacter mangrovi]